MEVHPLLKPCPPRVPHHLLAVQPRHGWTDSHGVFDPFNDIPRASPVWSGPSSSHSGSARRFSQPLSGFLARPSFAALFHAAAIPGTSPSHPSELSPRRKRAPLSRSLAPWQSSTACWDAPRGPCHQRFHRRPSGRRESAPGGLDPPLAMSSLSPPPDRDRGAGPGRSGSATTGSARSAASPASKPVVPPASPFTLDVSCPTPDGRCSPGLQPLQSFHLPPPGALRPTRTSRRIGTRAPSPHPNSARRDRPERDVDDAEDLATLHAG
jgi:hypothetical protein